MPSIDRLLILRTKRKTKAEASSASMPKTETLKVERPKHEQPKLEQSKPERPKVRSPKGETAEVMPTNVELPKAEPSEEPPTIKNTYEKEARRVRNGPYKVPFTIPNQTILCNDLSSYRSHNHERQLVAESDTRARKMFDDFQNNVFDLGEFLTTQAKCKPEKDVYTSALTDFERVRNMKHILLNSCPLFFLPPTHHSSIVLRRPFFPKTFQEAQILVKKLITANKRIVAYCWLQELLTFWSEYGEQLGSDCIDISVVRRALRANTLGQDTLSSSIQFMVAIQTQLVTRVHQFMLNWNDVHPWSIKRKKELCEALEDVLSKRVFVFRVMILLSDAVEMLYKDDQFPNALYSQKGLIFHKEHACHDGQRCVNRVLETRNVTELQIMKAPLSRRKFEILTNSSPPAHIHYIAHSLKHQGRRGKTVSPREMHQLAGKAPSLRASPAYLNIQEKTVLHNSVHSRLPKRRSQLRHEIVVEDDST